MGRILAIDYGSKRAGIAVTDENKIIATALVPVLSKDIFIFLRNYTEKESVECFVVGEPKQMNNKASESVKVIEPFVRRLKKEFPDIKTERFDERFTSKMASEALFFAGYKKKVRQQKENIDQVSAVILLQSYLDFVSKKK
jgi:putative Holliday junction resolvase